jgi:hypothetical protein
MNLTSFAPHSSFVPIDMFVRQDAPVEDHNPVMKLANGGVFPMANRDNISCAYYASHISHMSKL